MQNSFFKFFATTSPGLEKHLQQELQYLGLKVKLERSTSQLTFRTNYLGMFKVLHQSRMIEDLKVQLGCKLVIRGDEELRENLPRLPFHSFIKNNYFSQFTDSNITTKSFRSTLFHEKKISSIMLNHLHSLDSGPSRISQHQHQEAIQKLEHQQKIGGANKASIKQNQNPLVASTALQKNSKNNEPTGFRIPRITCYLVENIMKIALNINYDSLHKHGFKSKVQWAPLKETVAHAALFQMGILKRVQNGEEVNLWDPFCGSGTIMLEMISRVYSGGFREKQDFSFWPGFPDKEYDLFLEQQTLPSEKPNKMCLVSSDLSSKAVLACKENTSTFSFLKQSKHAQNEKGYIFNPSALQFCFQNSQINIVQGDFEVIAKSLLENFPEKKFSILCNLPYGVRSKEHLNQHQFKQLYKRFDRFIRKNRDKFDQVYIFTSLSKMAIESLLQDKKKTSLKKFQDVSNEIGRQRAKEFQDEESNDEDSFEETQLPVQLDHQYSWNKLDYIVKEQFSMGGLEVFLYQLEIESPQRKELALQRKNEIILKKEQTLQKERELFKTRYSLTKYIVKPLTKQLRKSGLKKTTITSIIRRKRLLLANRYRYNNEVLDKRRSLAQQIRLKAFEKLQSLRKAKVNSLINAAVKENALDAIQENNLIAELQQKLDKRVKAKIQSRISQSIKNENKYKIPKW